jgi:hypothetical protein
MVQQFSETGLAQKKMHSLQRERSWNIIINRLSSPHRILEKLSKQKHTSSSEFTTSQTFQKQ